jgi:hypothetical protein
MPLPPSRTPPYRAHSLMQHGLRLPLSFRTQRFLDPLAHAHPARAAILLLVYLWYCMERHVSIALCALICGRSWSPTLPCFPWHYGSLSRLIASCTQHTPHANTTRTSTPLAPYTPCTSHTPHSPHTYHALHNPSHPSHFAHTHHPHHTTSIHHTPHPPHTTSSTSSTLSCAYASLRWHTICCIPWVVHFVLIDQV